MYKWRIINEQVGVVRNNVQMALAKYNDFLSCVVHHSTRRFILAPSYPGSPRSMWIPSYTFVVPHALPNCFFVCGSWIPINKASVKGKQNTFQRIVIPSIIIMHHLENVDMQHLPLSGISPFLCR